MRARVREPVRNHPSRLLALTDLEFGSSRLSLPHELTVFSPHTVRHRCCVGGPDGGRSACS
jgi:hypothetical protein